MKINKSISGFILTLFILMGLACANFPNKGIELGNPDELEGKAITIVPDGSVEIYTIRFGAQSQAEVTQIIENVFESVGVSFTFQSGVIFLAAGFTNGSDISLTIQVDNSGTFTSANLVLNNKPVASGFDIEPTEMVCDSGISNAATQIVQSLCSRIVVCNNSYSCESCESNVEIVPSLVNQFGTLTTNNMQETAAEIENGNILVDEAALAECLLDINLVPCVLVQDLFNDQEPPNYQAINALVPKPACAKGILKSK